MSFQTPILFLIFSRPNTTKQVFERIREIKPKYLYVAADGPRDSKEGELEKTKEVRKIVLDGIDWDCEVKTLFREQNLGCRQAVNQAITWFFDNVEMGIVIEDDILADLSFFHFAENLLVKYQSDERIMMISGHNHLGDWNHNNASYFFSQLGAIWGWATWRRAWSKNQNIIPYWDTIKENHSLEKIFKHAEQAEYRKYVTSNTISGAIDTWDYIWTLTRLVNSGNSILPSKNLISNIGFDEDATHTKSTNLLKEAITSQSLDISKLSHPDFVYPDLEYDEKVFFKYTNPKKEVKNENRIIKLTKKTRRKFLASSVVKEEVTCNSTSELLGYNQLSGIIHKFNSYLPHTSSALSYYAIATIANDITINNRKNILELGSGISSLILAKIIKINNLDSNIYSFDNNLDWINILEKVKVKENLNNLKLIYAPLKSYNKLWYDEEAIQKELTILPSIDSVIIDGPEAWQPERKYARSFALKVIYGYLNKNCSIFVDDVNRLGEKETIYKWENSYNLNFIKNENFAVAFKGQHFNIFL